MFDGIADLEQIAIVLRQVFETGVRRLDEDVGLESCPFEHPLYAEDFVTNRVTIAERRQNLMNLRLQFSTGSFDSLCSLRTGPEGSPRAHRPLAAMSGGAWQKIPVPVRLESG